MCLRNQTRDRAHGKIAGGMADREAHVTEKEAELELRETVAEKLEREWSTRHRDVVNLIEKFETSGGPGTKVTI